MIPIHRQATVIAGIRTFFDLFDIFLAGVVGTVLTEEFELSRVSLPAALWIVMLDIALFAPSTTGRSLEHANA